MFDISHYFLNTSFAVGLINLPQFQRELFRPTLVTRANLSFRRAVFRELVTIHSKLSLDWAILETSGRL